jgi:hypothetical protein
MKPYKIIKSKGPLRKRTILVGRLKAPKIPLRFFAHVHTPPKATIVN